MASVDPGEDNTDDERLKLDSEAKRSIPLHRLMLDYKERKEELERERLQRARKSARARRAPNTFVAEPASGKRKPDERKREEEHGEEGEDRVDLFKLIQEWKSEADERPPVQITGDAMQMVNFAFATIVSLSRKQGCLTMPKKLLETVAVSRPVTSQQRGVSFPVQLMNLLIKDAVPEGLWWIPRARGRVFAVDLDFFKDENVAKFFPSISYKKLTCALKRWGFEKSSDHKLLNSAQAYFHPLFRRNRPSDACKINFVGIKHSAKFVQKQQCVAKTKAKTFYKGVAALKAAKKKEVNASLKNEMSISMSAPCSSLVTTGATKQSASDASERSLYPFLYPENSRARHTRSAAAQDSSPDQKHPRGVGNSDSLERLRKAHALCTAEQNLRSETFFPRTAATSEGSDLLGRARKKQLLRAAERNSFSSAFSPDMASSEFSHLTSHSKRTPERSHLSNSTSTSTGRRTSTVTVTPNTPIPESGRAGTTLGTPRESETFGSGRSANNAILNASSDEQDIARRINYYLEEDRRLRELIAAKLMKASQAKRWSPLDVLATNEEIGRLTAERDRLRRLCAEAEKVLRQYNELKKTRQQREQAYAADKQRRKRQRLMAEHQHRVDSDEAARRQRLANALFGTNGTSPGRLTAPTSTQEIYSTVSEQPSLDILRGTSGNGTGMQPTMSTWQTRVEGPAATINSITNHSTNNVLDIISRLRQQSARSSQTASLHQASLLLRQAVAERSPSNNHTLSYEEVLFLQRLANTGHW